MFFLFLSPILKAQDRCGFDIVHQKQLKENPAYRKQTEEQDKWISNYIQRQSGLQRDQSMAVQYTIPVVVHVIHTGGAVGTIYNPSDANIQNAINYLNQVYNGSYPGIEGVGDIEIQFALAVRDPNCNATTGINRIDGSGLPGYTSDGVKLSGSAGAIETDVKNLVRWDPSRYYNIWVVNKIDTKDGTSGSFVAGYAYFPGASPALDGTVMLATQMLPNRKTLPHEIGHAFSLYHPFQGASGSTCPTNGDCNIEGDRVCDTDPVTQPVGFVCGTGTNACTSTPFSINTEHNFMNYTNCATLFTAGQKARLLAGAASSARIGLTNSYALSPVYPLLPYVAPSAASCTPVTSAVGLSNDYAGILGFSLAAKSSRSGTARTDNGYLNRTANCQELIQLQRGTSYTIDVTLLGVNAEQLKGWIDFNNDGILNAATEQIIAFAETDDPAPARSPITVSGAFTVPANGILNTALRLRLMDEVSTIYGVPALTSACINPDYGQAEDYAVYLLPSGTLPLNLIQFSGKFKGSSVLLNWETTAEINTEKFIIQRSSDNQKFSDIGQLVANGKNKTSNNYSFSDNDVNSGQWYYRLKILDTDNNTEFSKTIHITVPVSNAGKTVILGNPVSGSLELQLKKYTGLTRLSISDITGRIILSREIPPGTYRYSISETIKLRQGIYLLEITQGSERETKRFIKK